MQNHLVDLIRGTARLEKENPAEFRSDTVRNHVRFSKIGSLFLGEMRICYLAQIGFPPPPQAQLFVAVLAGVAITADAATVLAAARAALGRDGEVHQAGRGAVASPRGGRGEGHVHLHAGRQLGGDVTPVGANKSSI